MHNSRPHNAVYSRKGIAAVKHKRVYKRSPVIPGCGMNHHTLRLVYNKQVAVLIDYIKRNIFRSNIISGRLGHRYGDGIPRLYLIAF